MSEVQVPRKGKCAGRISVERASVGSGIVAEDGMSEGQMSDGNVS